VSHRNDPNQTEYAVHGGFFTGKQDDVITAESPTSTKFRWDRLTYSSALGYSLLVCGLSVGAVLGELRQEFHISGVIAALHGSTFGIASLLAGFFGVRVVDRLGRRTSLLVSAVAITCGVLMLCLGPVWQVTLAGTALSGLGGALLVMVMPALISDHHGEHRATAFAAVNGAPGLAGVTFGLVVGAALALELSWRPPYLILTGIILVALGLVPKLGAIIASIPLPVLGGAGLALFGTVAASGIRALSRVDYDGTSNIIIVAVSIAMGVLPIASPTFYEHFPSWFQTIFDSGISAAALTAVLLNLLFNGTRRDAEAPIAAEGPTPGVVPDEDVPGGRSAG